MLKLPRVLGLIGKMMIGKGVNAEAQYVRDSIIYYLYYVCSFFFLLTNSLI